MRKFYKPEFLLVAFLVGIAIFFIATRECKEYRQGECTICTDYGYRLVCNTSECQTCIQEGWIWQ